ncbi:polysaccharide biosynthesis/export family protein [Flavobacterium sp. 3HN19-14]|uniref:polysaccharide biosynthesis/export family protein n=1 Tax=Flavobacterium sp. 3HN19-14 TaxID=3448133 RepID=UPI003EE04265
MKLRIVFPAILVLLSLTSCISTKDMTYLQRKDKDAIESPVNPIVSKPYRLQTNDILSISIKASDQSLAEIFNPKAGGGQEAQSEQDLYFNGFTIDDHGNIRMPIIGEINVLGYTVDEARIKIEKQLLTEYFTKEANIFVSVKLAGLRFTANGEVGAPGTKTIFQDKVTILEALANSGDILITGDRKHVTIIRQYSHGTEMHDIDLTDIKAMQSPYYYLQPNDYIYVKPLEQKSWGTGRTGVESIGSIVTLISLATTVFLLLKN